MWANDTGIQKIAMAQKKYKTRRRCETNRELRRWYKTRPQIDYPDIERPQYRGQCKDEERPCPWVSCKYHLYLDVKKGVIRYADKDKEPWEMKESCVLDVIENSGAMVEEDIADILSIHRSRVEQIMYQIKLKLQQIPAHWWEAIPEYPDNPESEYHVQNNDIQL